VDWAVTLIQNDYDCESLRILAGLDNSDTQEREKYFLKSANELNINLDKKDIELIDYYADYIVEEVLTGRIQPKYALSQMLEVVQATNYDRKYVDFFMLDEEIDGLQYENVTAYTIDEYILNEFRLFKKIQDGGLADYYGKAICNNCNQVMIPQLVKKYQLKRPFTYQAWACENCKSQNIDHFSTQTGKEKIITRLTRA